MALMVIPAVEGMNFSKAKNMSMFVMKKSNGDVRSRRSRWPLKMSKGLGAVQPGSQTPRSRCEGAAWKVKHREMQIRPHPRADPGKQ